MTHVVAVLHRAASEAVELALVVGDKLFGPLLVVLRVRLRHPLAVGARPAEAEAACDVKVGGFAVLDLRLALD